MKADRLQCKDIPERPILALLERNPGVFHTWCSGWERTIRPAVSVEVPDKLLIRKMDQMIKKGLVDGCGCGCRGDYRITEKGQEQLYQV